MIRPKAVMLDPGNPNRSAEPADFFFGNGYLYSRMETSLTSNQDFYDEDVNVYLIALLTGFLNPEELRWRDQYTILQDGQMLQRWEANPDIRLRYNCYRCTADHLLMMISVFETPGTLSRHLGWTDDAWFGRCRTYYHLAAVYGEQLSRRSATPEVLEKIAVGGNKYRRILGHLAHEHFNLINHLTPGQEFHLQRDVDEQGRQTLLLQRTDTWLDALGVYRADPTPEHFANYLTAVQQLKAVNPMFDEANNGLNSTDPSGTSE